MDASLTVVVAFKSRCLGHLLFQELISQTLDGSLKPSHLYNVSLNNCTRNILHPRTCFWITSQRSSHSGATFWDFKGPVLKTLQNIHVIHLGSLFFYHLPISMSHSIYCKCFVSVHICPSALLQMSFVAWQFPRLSEVKSRLPAIQRHRLGAALSRLRVKSTYSWMHGTYSRRHGSQI